MRVLIRLTAPPLSSFMAYFIIKTWVSIFRSHIWGVFEEISKAIAPSSFKANDAKTVEPCEGLSVFNCDLSMGRVTVLTEGNAEFFADC